MSVVFAFLTAVSLARSVRNVNDSAFLIVSFLLLSSLYIVIYAYTLLALYGIRRTIKARDDVQIKQKTLVQHLVAITLFVFTGLYSDYFILSK